MTPEFRTALPYLGGAFILVCLWGWHSRKAAWAQMGVEEFVLAYNKRIVIGLLLLAFATHMMALVARCQR